VAIIAIWNRGSHYQFGKKWCAVNCYKYCNKYVFIPVDRAECISLLFVEIQNGAFGHRKGGYNVYPVPDSFFHTQAVPYLYACLFRRNFIDMGDSHHYP
jgi:hypothetical protein